MKVTCVQMNMAFGAPKQNFEKAARLIEEAVKTEHPDVIVLPETWNTGFFPHDGLEQLALGAGEAVKTQIGALAKAHHVNIVAGSVADDRDGAVYNTCYVFDRAGTLLGAYDKTHLFSPMDEDKFFQKGDHLLRFSLDGQACGVIICYDIRFPELVRTYCVQGLDFLFVVSQWPKVRIPHLLALTKARAIENQMFVICCNSCGTAGATVYGGASSIHDPWGEQLALADAQEQRITADCDPSVLAGIRGSINVFRDRRPELYDIQ